MKVKWIVFGAAVLGLAGGGITRGQERKPPMPENARFGNPTSIARAYQFYLYGVIKKLDNKEMVLEKTRYGVDTPVKLTSKTRYVRNRKQSTLEALHVGDQVYVDVKNDKKTGDKIAKKVLSGVMPGS
jgi:hypothetical protein